MPPEVVERAFEPFFTTKREGEGTGLGLSMVYGFVKQSGGHIKIYSEQGNGTTVKVYLPRIHQSEVHVSDVRKEPVLGGAETVLVVEDDMAVQATAVEILTELGYKVLKTNDGQRALSILQSGVSIDLLFTDVVMPGRVRSPDLARQAKALLPDIEVLFTSGYTQNAIVHGGRLDPRVDLISKPYRREDLARKIRHMPTNRKQASGPQNSYVGGMERSDAHCSTKTLRILVVEDNADSQQMLCELLNLLGHAARGVPNAEAAIRILDEDSFDVLLTDVGLPGMSGVELAKKAVNANPGMKIIFSSGYGAVENVGFESLSLPKPYDIHQIRKVLAQVA
jgi:CheY-like chemotaxis protein